MNTSDYSSNTLNALPQQAWSDYDAVLSREGGNPDRILKITQTAKDIFSELQSVKPTDLNTLKMFEPKIAQLIDNKHLGITGKTHLIKYLFAIFAGHENLIPQVLDNEWLINLTDKNGNSLLHQAIDIDDDKLLAFWLNQGADFNLTNKSKETPLHLATVTGSLNCVKVLLGAQAKIDAKDKQGQTPLHNACMSINLDIVKELLDHGADINAKDKQGQTALHLAAQQGNIDIIELLLERGSNLEQSADNGNTALNYAVNSDKLKAIQLLIDKNANVNTQDANGHSPLHIACAKENYATVKTLLDKGADINCKDNQGYTALHQAAQKGNGDIIELLVDRKIDLEQTNNDGETPLHSAISAGQLKVMQLLIDKNANINTQDKNGYSPLHVACSKGSYTIVKILLATGADINAKDMQGYTGLHMAAQQGNLDIIELLLDRKADLEQTNNDGETPLHSAVNTDQLKAIQLLINKGANVNTKDKNGFSPLHTACFKGNNALVNTLLDKGADINVKNNTGWGALHLAAQQGNNDIIKLLLDRGADLEQQKDNGETPLHSAANTGQLTTIKLFIDKGAKTNHLANSGYTPAMAALAAGYLDAFEVLQKDLNVELKAWPNHKLLSHRFGLSIQVEHQGKEIKFSGFSSCFTYPALLKSLHSSNTWIKDAPLSWTDDDTQAVLQNIEKARALIYSHRDLTNKVNEILKAYDNEEVVVLPCNPKGHYNTVILYKNFFIKGDRSLVIESEGKRFPLPGLMIFKMQPKNLKNVVSLLLTEDYDPQSFYSEDIRDSLNLVFLSLNKHQVQHGSVCSWASAAKLSFQGAILAHLLKKGMALNEAEEYSQKMYRSWAKEDRIIATEDYLKNVPDSDVKTSVLACIYKHLSEKKDLKQHYDPILKLIEQHAPQAVALSANVEISKDQERVAQVKMKKE